MPPILAAMLSVQGTILTDKEKKILEQSNPLGLTLFKRNISDKKQLKTLIKSIKETIGRDDVLIAIDQEGGRVQRLTAPVWKNYASEYALGSLPEQQAIQATRLHGQLIANDLSKMGINLNYSPVLDVRYADTTPALQSRTFSDNASTIALLGKNLLEALHNNGICACIKHLPGHGRAIVDPHFNLPIITETSQALEEDFLPFMEVANIAVAGMTAHILLQDIDDKPATQSHKIIHNIIRDQIGFKGFLFSDAIDMHALKGSLSEKTQTSLAAGCDAVCYCMGNTDEMQEVIKAALPLTDEALSRLTKLKDIFLNTKQPLKKADEKLLYDKYLNLTAKAKNLMTDYDAVEVLHHSV